DTEQRDIWEYDLDLDEKEVLNMVRHIWELNGTQSRYYFFTENCSYNMLWLIELARPSIHLREYFNYQVIPLETVHATKLEGIISNTNYRASKRSILLKYEKLIHPLYLHMPRELVNKKIILEDILNNEHMDIQQKRYILEAATEFLEYSFSKNDMNKEDYLELFYTISKKRAELGQGQKLNIEIPHNPINSHRAIKTTLSLGERNNETLGFLGIRPAYHDLEDSGYGFLRATQIEFLNLLFSYKENEVKVENATIISIVSLAQRSEFFDSFSWRTKFGWDNDYVNNKTNFISTVGFGYSWGNELAYLYGMAEPLFYVEDKLVSAMDGSIGLVIDAYPFMSTNFEAKRRYYDTGDAQWLIKVSQNFRLMQNLQMQFKYDYKQKYFLDNYEKEETYRASVNYYF
ncbi:DUF4105 domain-containing protein, partial [bacterium]|nr:DUF4105 domain-containing protein [bacterium]